VNPIQDRVQEILAELELLSSWMPREERSAIVRNMQQNLGVPGTIWSPSDFRDQIATTLSEEEKVKVINQAYDNMAKGTVPSDDELAQIGLHLLNTAKSLGISA